MSIIARELLVVKRPIIRGDDPGVAEFGAPKPLRNPSRREPQKDAVDVHTQSYLHTSALNRALHFAYGLGDIRSVKVQFPNGEHYKDRVFDQDHWRKYGNMESERARTTFMLDTYGQQRGFPVEFGPLVNVALGAKDTLASWKSLSPSAAKTAKTIYTDIKGRMVANKKVDPMAQAYGYTGAYDSPPIHYKTAPEVTSGERLLLDKALTQLARELQGGNYRNVGGFLDLYARVKDPITPISSTLSNQKSIFVNLFQRAAKELERAGVKDIADERGKTLLMQLALESSFLSLPAAKGIFYVRGDGEHHELPYVYVDLKGLPRGEFTDPKFALPQLEIILHDAKDLGRPIMTPIAVSHFQTPGEAKPAMFIVDGNNRSTALMTLSYLHATGVSYEQRADPKRIKDYINLHKLHPGWERELSLTLKALPQPLYDDAVGDKARLKKLVNARVPALLVQEPNFHTIAVEASERYRPAIYLLQPMHQAIYNHDELAMAIPPKKQTHGRAPANNILVEAIPQPRLPVRRRYHLREERSAA